MARKYVDIKLTTDIDFDRLLSTNPEMRKQLEEAVRVIMWDARDMLSNKLKGRMHDSAREAHKAVRNIVYQRIIGGELNILNVRRALRRGNVPSSSRGRTANTERILSYHGIDRGFILRFVNDGTDERWTENMDGHVMKRKSVNERPKSRRYVYPDRLGGRGGAAKRNGNTIGMFADEGDPIMAKKAMELRQLIDKIIDKNLR